LNPRAGVSNYTLWRNGQLLGRVRISFPVANNKAGIGGMLEVEEAFTDIAELMQHSWPTLPGRTFQSLTADAPSHVVLREMSEAEAQGLPPERILVIRDSAGEDMVFKFLSIMRLPGPIPNRGELFEECQQRGIAPSPWMLLAH
jgi:hypothetical protein